MEKPTFDPATAAPHFDACIAKIGSYAEAARRLKLKTAWGVQKWRAEGVPPAQVPDFVRLAEFVATPHQLRPDVFRLPGDGVPREILRRLAA